MAAIHHPLPQARRSLPLPVRGARLNWWIVGAVIIFGIGALLPVLQSSTATTRGFDVQRLEARQAAVQGDIRLLESEVAELTSLGRIENRAREIGLVPGADPMFVTVDVPGPAPANIPAANLPSLDPQDEAAPWWRSFISWALPGN